jgi:hypothetical protein
MAQRTAHRGMTSGLSSCAVFPACRCERALFASACPACPACPESSRGVLEGSPRGEATPNCSTLASSASHTAERQHVISSAPATCAGCGAIPTCSDAEDNTLHLRRHRTETESAPVPFSTRLHPPPPRSRTMEALPAKNRLLQDPVSPDGSHRLQRWRFHPRHPGPLAQLLATG